MYISYIKKMASFDQNRKQKLCLHWNSTIILLIKVSEHYSERIIIIHLVIFALDHLLKKKEKKEKKKKKTKLEEEKEKEKEEEDKDQDEDEGEGEYLDILICMWHILSILRPDKAYLLIK